MLVLCAPVPWLPLPLSLPCGPCSLLLSLVPRASGSRTLGLNQDSACAQLSRPHHPFVIYGSHVIDPVHATSLSPLVTRATSPYRCHIALTSRHLVTSCRVSCHIDLPVAALVPPMHRSVVKSVSLPHHHFVPCGSHLSRPHGILLAQTLNHTVWTWFM